MGFKICPNCNKIIFDGGIICPQCNCDITTFTKIEFDNSEFKNPEFEIRYQERPNIWKYIYIENNEKQIISAPTKHELKEKVIHRGLKWDESKIKGVATMSSQNYGEGYNRTPPSGWNYR